MKNLKIGIVRTSSAPAKPTDSAIASGPNFTSETPPNTSINRSDSTRSRNRLSRIIFSFRSNSSSYVSPIDTSADIDDSQTAPEDRISRNPDVEMPLSSSRPPGSPSISISSSSLSMMDFSPELLIDSGMKELPPPVRRPSVRIEGMLALARENSQTYRDFHQSHNEIHHREIEQKLFVSLPDRSLGVPPKASEFPSVYPEYISSSTRNISHDTPQYRSKFRLSSKLWPSSKANTSLNQYEYSGSEDSPHSIALDRHYPETSFSECEYYQIHHVYSSKDESEGFKKKLHRFRRSMVG